MYALISTRPRFETPDKRRGDVLVVRASSANFGAEEYRQHLAVEWDDPDLEALVPPDADPSQVVLVHPYAVFDQDAEGNQIMLMRSRRALNIDAMPADLRAEILDETQPIEVLSWAQISPYVVTRNGD